MGFKDLENAIKDASQKYYTDGTSPYTDEQFDSMLDELKTENPESELLTAVGHGYSVDEYVMKTGKKKVKHKYGIVGSLEKAYTWDDIKNDIKYAIIEDISLKLDGLSVVLYYLDGVMYQALTRGVNGYGIDITNKVMHILAKTECVLEDRTFTGAVRGEIIMTDWDFERYKQDIDSEAKNSRNTAAGIINSKDIDANLLGYLEVRVYSIVGCEHIEFERRESIVVDSIRDMRSWLENNFIATVPCLNYIHLYEETYLDELSCIYEGLRKDLPADGLVMTVRVETINNQVMLFSQAFKFGAESGETTVTNIEWNLTKTRYLMPKLNVEPLFLSGTNVENATGYNAKWIKDNNIGIGSVIEISKHGEIIPNVDRVIKATGAKLPDRCPECNEILFWNGVHLQCTNPACGNAQVQDLLVWLQNLVPADYLGKNLKLKWLEQFYGTDELSIPIVMSGLPYLPYITDNAEHNLGIQGKAVADMLLDLYRKEFKLVDVIKALNIPRFGDVNAQKLSEYPDLVKALYSARKTRMRDMVLEKEVSAIDYQTSIMIAENEYASKIGVANMNSLIENIYKFDNLKYIWDRIIFDVPKAAEVEFKGKVAITGKLSVKRADFEAELKAAGYEPKEISKDTKFLITDNPDSSSSKNKKADQWGIVKITEDEFRKEYL